MRAPLRFGHERHDSHGIMPKSSPERPAIRGAACGPFLASKLHGFLRGWDVRTERTSECSTPPCSSRRPSVSPSWWYFPNCPDHRRARPAATRHQTDGSPAGRIPRKSSGTQMPVRCGSGPRPRVSGASFSSNVIVGCSVIVGRRSCHPWRALYAGWDWFRLPHSAFVRPCRSDPPRPRHPRSSRTRYAAIAAPTTCRIAPA